MEETMSKLDDALKRFEQVATNGFKGSDYMQVDDSRAWFREDLAVIKKSVELLGLYREYLSKVYWLDNCKNAVQMNEIAKVIHIKEKEIEEMKHELR